MEVLAEGCLVVRLAGIYINDRLWEVTRREVWPCNYAQETQGVALRVCRIPSRQRSLQASIGPVSSVLYLQYQLEHNITVEVTARMELH